MRATIDRAGRIVVPKSIRDRLRLYGGQAIEIDEVDGVIEVRPASSVMAIVQTREGPVLASDDEAPPLDDAAVREILEQTRR